GDQVPLGQWGLPTLLSLRGDAVPPRARDDLRDARAALARGRPGAAAGTHELARKHRRAAPRPRPPRRKRAPRPAPPASAHRAQRPANPKSVRGGIRGPADPGALWP